ncbi:MULTISPECIES: NAD-dependent epimerase/dehydratase family protein [unclassified Exiguobacterium]|uniref:NAD-dependent epimerase/dehydratase family protein n=1 Tax=unclassified Exiguobacterium TaxID=2644629 RepID=UPI00103E434B|nr:MULTISPECIES: NAD-dependent epimerase/dehydratase family protein [unclassified Exiguobacterium]TCI48275.1 NAD-dependent epimerase/dehydratase family protein [Exiguobacterium sp. SH5S32]TCI55161.1 NAD-dependent epimerase/dehydratase family protein [Exiguobacterium sp. SH1S4]TCI74955.1 NAD-dependent epimerase/dehydratase family protein [Exiguobacterium sp. SH1S1]
MKKILITGENSYVGNSFQTFLLNNYPRKYSIEKLSLRNQNWKKQNLEGYDAVVHVAAIVHKKETENSLEFYRKINRDLTYEIARKAKNDKVPHFIFISTMSVYGKKSGIIDQETELKPNTNYGISKLEAEERLQQLQDQNFNITIVRPPMIYGKRCGGNYNRLSKFSIISPVFIQADNQRSMIFIDNLSEYLRIMIENKVIGIVHVQNKEYINTSDMYKAIREVHEKKILVIKAPEFLRKIMNSNNFLNKIFGDLVYSKKISFDIEDYEDILFSDLETSIRLTEDIT